MKYLSYTIMILLCATVSAVAIEEGDFFEVEFLVYSGRPNPTFIVRNDAVITEIENRVESLIVEKTVEHDPSTGLREISPGFILCTMSIDGAIKSELLIFRKQCWRITKQGKLEVLNDVSSGTSLMRILVEEGESAGIFFREKPE